MPPATLIVGYGNPGRQDDGLGPALVAALEPWAAAERLDHLAFEAGLQLNIEHALSVAGHDVVIFADATSGGEAPFVFRRLAPRPGPAFSTHTLSPEAVLAVCAALYDRQPEAYLLALRGQGWEARTELTPAAQTNLAAALDFIKPLLRVRLAG